MRTHDLNGLDSDSTHIWLRAWLGFDSNIRLDSDSTRLTHPTRSCTCAVNTHIVPIQYTHWYHCRRWLWSHNTSPDEFLYYFTFPRSKFLTLAWWLSKNYRVQSKCMDCLIPNDHRVTKSRLPLMPYRINSVREIGKCLMKTCWEHMWVVDCNGDCKFMRFVIAKIPFAWTVVLEALLPGRL